MQTTTSKPIPSLSRSGLLPGIGKKRCHTQKQLLGIHPVRNLGCPIETFGHDIQRAAFVDFGIYFIIISHLAFANGRAKTRGVYYSNVALTFGSPQYFGDCISRLKHSRTRFCSGIRNVSFFLCLDTYFDKLSMKRERTLRPFDAAQGSDTVLKVKMFLHNNLDQMVSCF